MKRLIVIGVLIMLALTADTTQAKPQPYMALHIPAVGISTTVIVAPRVNGTWDFSRIWRTAGWLATTPAPATGGNTVIGAHDTLFRRIQKLHVGDIIEVRYGDERYKYKVERSFAVNKLDMSPVSQALYFTNVLTLMTCYGQQINGEYQSRYVVQARLITGENHYDI